MINNNPLTTTERVEEPLIISIANTPLEKREIYHLRYQVYIEEMSKHFETVDYANKLLADELDNWGILLSAKIGSKLIATARINIGTVNDFPREEIEYLSLNTFKNCPIEYGEQQFAFITKIMIHPTHRSSQAFYLLIAKCYELCCTNEVQFMFGICNWHLIRLYEKIGIQRYYKNFLLPGHGILTPLVLLINDTQHLRTVHSPLFRIARKRGTVNTQAVEWFHTNLNKHIPIINSQIVTEQELWTMLCDHISSPLKEITILYDLSITEAQKFLHSCGSFIHCTAGEQITTQGNVSYSYHILLSGSLKSLTQQHPAKEYTLPGQHFGANGLTEHNKHVEDIVTTHSTEIFTLSSIAFQKFFHSFPDIAHKIIRNMTRPTTNKLLNTEFEAKYF